jgi:pimeloyl-ACP methyl ester carboxylesterase
VSSIVTPQGIVHYESYGRGRPVILLHGWINSWGVWEDFMVNLAESAPYKVYALDFWGFGESAKTMRGQSPPFKVAAYGQMVDQFMEALGIQSAPVFGHSMGGTVALTVALEYPERVKKVAIVGSPINGDSLNIFLKWMGVDWMARLVWRLPVIVRTFIRIILMRDPPRVQKMVLRDVQQTSIESFFLSIGDLHHTNLEPRLSHLQVPVLGVFGEHDVIVDPKEARRLAEGVKLARIEMMPISGHFPMLDDSEHFNQTLRHFLEH